MATGGLYGNTTLTVTTFFTWFVYQQTNTAPATPTGGAWNFTTNVGIPPTLWSNTPPATPTQQVWISTAFVSSKNPTVLSWTTPALWSGVGVTSVPYPSAGIPFSNGAAWTASYSLSGTGTVIALAANAALTGIPTAPTAILGTNSTQLATTAFVAAANSAITGVGNILYLNLNTQSGGL